MRSLRAWVLRLTGLLNKQRRERELAEELEGHLQLHIEDNLRRGMTPVEARRQALIKLGGIEQTKEIYRDRRGLPVLESLVQDLRYALRNLRKNRGFTVVVVVTLALGTGANTAIFSVVNGILLTPLPYKDPGRLVMIRRDDPNADELGANSYPRYLDLKNNSRSFEDIAAFDPEDHFYLVGGSGPEIVFGPKTTENLFRVLGAHPLLGRTFLPEEEQPGTGSVAIISYRLWQRRYNGDPTILGKQIRVASWDRIVSRTIVGVMPPGFTFPSEAEIGRGERGEADLWVPYGNVDPERAQGLLHDRSVDRLVLVGRLRSDVGQALAQQEMRSLALRLRKQYPKEDEGLGIRLVSLHEETVGRVRPSLMILLATVGFLLLIACANVANLLLARTAARERELAVRASLGASRGRLFRLLLSDSLLLALFGGGAGVLLSAWVLEALVALAPEEVPRLGLAEINGPVLGFSLLVGAVIGLLFGLAPALQASKLDLNESLREGGRSLAGSRRGQRLRNVLVVVEIGLSLVMLTGAGLMIRSFIHLQRYRWGFSPDGLVTMMVHRLGPQGFWMDPGSMARLIAFEKNLLRRVETLPGVQSASLAGILINWGMINEFEFEGQNRPAVAVRIEKVSPNYFRTMGMALLRGREFSERDNMNTPMVGIINQAMARRYYAGVDPLGKRLQRDWFDGHKRWVTIVGVVSDMQVDAFQESVRPVVYYPWTQLPPNPMTVVVRTSNNPKAFAGALQQALWSVDKDQPALKVETVSQTLGALMSERRFMMALLGAFALLSIVLAAVGIYGVISYSVEQRTHEIGVRMAIGADGTDVLRLVVRHAFLLAALGVGIGLAAALALTRFLSSMLYRVQPTDLATFAAVSILLVSVALFACYIPARRATKVDPMQALRCE